MMPPWGRNGADLPAKTRNIITQLMSVRLSESVNMRFWASIAECYKTAAGTK